ncbi:hypothetical protein [Bradyrhizobium sp. 5.13L]
MVYRAFRKFGWTNICDNRKAWVVMILNPAKAVIEKIGGYEAAAGITGKHITRVYRWTYPTSRGGTGGVIPHSDALKLLNHAKFAGIALAAEDFLREPSVVDGACNA